MTPDEMLRRLLTEHFYADREHGFMWDYEMGYGLQDTDPELNTELVKFIERTQ